MRQRHTARPLPLVVALALVACTSTSSDVAHEAPPPPPRLTTEPWTAAFEQPSVLVAKRIEIRGPDRLADRFVAVQDPGNVEVRVETTPEGLLQTFRALTAGSFARGQLDAWQVAASEELVVLQEPGRVDVRIEAVGDAFFQSDGEAQPVRGGTFTIRGEVDWPDANP